MKTETTKKQRIQILLSVLIVVIGVLLMIIKIVAESEPGAIPLLLIILGIAWYFTVRNQTRVQHS